MENWGWLLVSGVLVGLAWAWALVEWWSLPPSVRRRWRGERRVRRRLGR
ncbi:MAG: hypothetical protein QN178_14015 [Armatimonadota bacterium]|nr:hypothetical protein [Armatimonadota bacterium]